MSKKMNLRDLKDEAKADLTPKESVKEDRFPIVEREMDFTIDYDAPDGQIYEAKLTSRIMDGEAKRHKSAIFSRLLNGQNPDSLSNDDFYRYDAISRVLVQVVDLPDWVAEFMEMDNELLAQLQFVLGGHESAYFRGNAKKGADGKAEKRVRVTAAFLKSNGAS